MDRKQIFTILKAQSGDRDALDQLFKGVQQSLYRAVYSIVGNRERAEDVTQDVFVILQKNLRHLKSPEYFSAWAYRIACREAVTRAKKRKRSEELHTSTSEAFDLEDTSIGDPLRNVLKEQIIGQIANAPDASRSVLTLHYIEDLTIAEIADVLELKLGTVKSRLAYGLQYLRRKIV